MTYRLDYSELREYGREIVRASETGERRLSLALRKSAFDIEADAKVGAPVDTGDLENSISTTVSGDTAEIGPTVEYGLYLEEGTEGPYEIPNAFGWGITVMHPGIAAQPYMAPAFDRRLPVFQRAQADILESVARGNG